MEHRTHGRTVGPHAPRARFLLAAAVTAAAAAAVPAAAAAQDADCDERAGTLGIQGLACEGCSFRMGRSGIEDARFRTEPRVIAVARGFTGGDRLRAGDRIVAIDGSLITTRAGSGKLVGLRVGQHVGVRVRRDGREVDLDLVAGSACELRRAGDAGEARLDFFGGSMPDVVPMPAPRAPPVSRPGVTPAPLAPFSSPPPAGYLGVALQCTDCGPRGQDAFFTTPPTILTVVEDGPAGRAGLRDGDEIVAVNGAAITTPEGARAFGGREPGDTLRLTVRRGDERRTATVVTTERPAAMSDPMAPLPPLPPLPASDRVRFEGRVGDVGIEVRGAPITVTRDQETGELVIRTGGNVIRITRTGG